MKGPGRNSRSLCSWVVWLVTGFVFGSALMAQGGAACPPGDAQRENINALVQGIANGHADPWGEVSQTDFIEAARQLCEEVSGDPIAGQIALLELATLIGDPHTGVEVALLQLPLRLGYFGTDLHVLAAAEEDIVGRRVTHIGGMDVLEAGATFGHLFSHHNEARQQVMLPLFLTMPEILAAEGWAEVDTATYRFADGTEKVIAGASLIGSGKILPRASLLPAVYPGWTTAWQQGRQPIWLSLPERSYFMAEHEGVVWVRIRTVQRQKGQPSLKAFFKKEVMPALSEAKKLVIDLRGNPGGNFTLLVPSLKKLAGHRLDTPETLFVATDHRTFSAAQYSTWTLTRETKATHIGTEPSDTLSSWIDANAIDLPHGQLRLYVSQREPLYGEDRGRSIRPTVEIGLTWDQYSGGRDPVWDWVFAQ